MTKIEDREEFIDRLIAKRLYFFCGKGDNTICFMQGRQRENTNNAIGYHYVGDIDEFSYDIGEEPIGEIISDAFEKYTNLVAHYVADKMNDTADKVFGDIVEV